MADYVILNMMFIIAVIGFVAAISFRALISKATAFTLIALLLLTAVFDNLIIISGIVAYDESKIAQLFIYRAPIEDFAYAIVAAMIVPCIFTLARGTK